MFLVYILLLPYNQILTRLHNERGLNQCLPKARKGLKLSIAQCELLLEKHINEENNSGKPLKYKKRANSKTREQGLA